MNKLQGFPSAYYITLEESVERQEYIDKQFSEYNITPIPLKSKRYAESDDVIEGEYLDVIWPAARGVCASHLKAIKKWYNETNEPYAFFCEDDVSLEPVQHWNFTWKEFMNELPNDWECVQLMWIKEKFDELKFRERSWNDWSATAYILTRGYAKKLIDTYHYDDAFHLTVKNSTVYPVIENILYLNLGKVYGVPLFVEEVKKLSTVAIEGEITEGQAANHHYSYDYVINWWKENQADIKTIMNISNDPLVAYAFDTENPLRNYELARWYHNQGQTASAISFYLRAADRTDDLLLAYECLIHMASCFKDQKNRNYTVRNLYQNAINILPKRPEAYFLLSRFDEWNKMYSDSYTTSTLALNFCDFNIEPLTNVEYPGKYGLIFEKAVSSYWWGKTKECKELFFDLRDNYKLNQTYKIAVEDNILRLGFYRENEKNNFNYDQNFDWSSLSHEDKVTIEREVVHEQVYRFWKDVKEDDIVLDIGASVGAYTISILDQKPSKVYCVEPSRKLLKILSKNCSEKIFNYKENPIITINKAIVNYENDKINIFGGEEEFSGITFKKLIDDYSINHVDFMKIDCEGGEYSIFKEENMNFLLNNVKFIAMEVHLNYEGCREKFKNFRDKYLTRFKNYKVMSCTRQNIEWGRSLDIKDRIFDESFIDNYTCEFMIYISNEVEHQKDYEHAIKNVNSEKNTESKFTFCSNKKNTSWIVDNFYDNPDEVRKFALEQDYLEGGIGKGFIGKRTHQQFLFSGLKEKFEEIMGRKITKWEEHGMNGRFQISWSGEPLVYHCDNQKWGGMLYLTPNAPYQCGTTLYAHKYNKARTYYDEGWDDAWRDVPGDCHLDGTSFEPVDVLGNVYNRLVIFDASCIHSASQYFGTVKENARLWQMFFFDTE